MDNEALIGVGPGKVALTDRRTGHAWTVTLGLRDMLGNVFGKVPRPLRLGRREWMRARADHIGDCVGS